MLGLLAFPLPAATRRWPIRRPLNFQLQPSLVPPGLIIPNCSTQARQPIEKQQNNYFPKTTLAEAQGFRILRLQGCTAYANSPQTTGNAFSFTQKLIQIQTLRLCQLATESPITFCELGKNL